MDMVKTKPPKKKVKMHPELCSGCSLCHIACALEKTDTIDIGRSFVRLLGEGEDINKIKLSKGCDMCGECFFACQYGAMVMTIGEESR